MTVRTRADAPTGEDVEDLKAWLVSLPTPLPVQQTQQLVCGAPEHGEGEGTWLFVEADAAAGVARCRCLACGSQRWIGDSEAHWTYPMMWSCPQCANSLAEVVAGLSLDSSGRPGWLALGARCTVCGVLCGLTDMALPGSDLALPAPARHGAAPLR